MITTEQKQNIINVYKVNEKDTGSSEVQIALIHNRILDLNNHFSKNKKDFHSRRGLLKLVSQRKRLLDYLKRKNIQFDKKSKSFEYGFNYVLEELLFVNHRIENQNLYSVYPGNQLQTMKNFSNGKYLKQTDLALNQLICIDLKIKK